MRPKKFNAADLAEYAAREHHQAKAAALAAGAGKLLTELWTNFGNETTIDVALSLLEQARTEQRLGTVNAKPPEATPNAGGKAE